jgi:hypothetical protein
MQGLVVIQHFDEVDLRLKLTFHLEKREMYTNFHVRCTQEQILDPPHQTKEDLLHRQTQQCNGMISTNETGVAQSHVFCLDKTAWKSTLIISFVMDAICLKMQSSTR